MKEAPSAELNREQTIRNMVDCLNTAFGADPVAIHLLTSHQVQCNDQLADHQYVIVDHVTGLPMFRSAGVTPLGVINGLLTSAGLPVIYTQWDRTDSKHPVMTGFGWREPDEKTEAEEAK